MKKKLFKILYIITCNLLILLLLIFISDIIIYCHYSKIYSKEHHSVFKKPKFAYIVEPYYGIDIKTYFDGSDNVYRGRKPDGLEYKGNEPVVIFGCSFAHGMFLNYNQTFSYKLAHVLKRPVYNRAFPGRGIEFMYRQSISGDFYNTVPPSDTVIYIMIQDHYRRLLSNFVDILDLHLIGHFNKKGNELILDGDNHLKNILISSYTFKELNKRYVKSYINNQKNEEKITDLVVFYFIKTRENLEKTWKKKINFTVIFFTDQNILYKKTLRKKLEDNNFQVIEIDKISDINLLSPEYMNYSTLHPVEKVWDVLTPLIAKEIQDKMRQNAVTD